MAGFLNISKRRKSLFKRISLAGMSLCVVVSLQGCGLFPKEEVVSSPRLKEPAKILYQTVEAKKDSISNAIGGSATFVSVEHSDLFFTYRGGRIKEIYVNVGEKVTKGQLLAELDTDDLQSQIAQKEIYFSKAQLSYDLMKTNEGKQVSLANMKLANLKKQLANLEAIPESARDNSDLKSIDDIMFQIKSEEIGLQILQESNKVSLQQSEYDIKLSKLELDNLKVEYNKARLVSPVDGTVNYKNPIKQGENINAYITIISVIDPGRMLLEHKGDKMFDFQLGMKVNVKIKDKDYIGEVVTTPATVPADADDSAKSSVRIKVDGLPADISLGQVANIEVVKEHKDNVIVLPKKLIFPSTGNALVVYVLENGVKKERAVEVGIKTETQVEIVAGVKEGDKIIDQ